MQAYNTSKKVITPFAPVVTADNVTGIMQEVVEALEVLAEDLDVLENAIQKEANITTVNTSTYDVNTNDRLLIADNTTQAITITLVNSAADNVKLSIKALGGTSAVTVKTGNASVDASSADIILAAHESLTLVSYQTNWLKI